MYGRSSRAIAPASDMAGRGDAGGTPLTARRAVSYHVDFPTRANAAQLEPYWPKPTKLAKWPVQAETAESSQNSKKKKKKVQNAPFELNLKP